MLWRPFRNDLTATGAAFGPKVNDPVRRLDHIQVVLDHYDGVAMIPKSLQYGQ